MSKKKQKANMAADGTIVANRKARFEYHLEKTFDAGMALLGWEVKSLRLGRAGITDAYVIIKQGEIYLLGAQFQPLPTASSHVIADPQRTRKLLLHKKEISELIGAIERKGYTLIPLKLYWRNGVVKCQFALAKGKKLYDKRQDDKDRDWNRQKQRIIRNA